MRLDLHLNKGTSVKQQGTVEEPETVAESESVTDMTARKNILIETRQILRMEHHRAAMKSAENATPAAEEAKTAEAHKAAPGFDGIFAFAGLLAVAYLVLGRRE